VIDAFSKMLKGMSEEEASGSISGQIDSFIKQNKMEEYLDGTEKVKAKYFTEQLKKSHSSTNKEKRVSEALIRSCIEVSKDTEKDLRSLLSTLKKS
jgi:paraquat-inducible protein B